MFKANRNAGARGTSLGANNLDGSNSDVLDMTILNLTGRLSRRKYEDGWVVAGFPAPAPGREGSEPPTISPDPGMVQIDASMVKFNQLAHMGGQPNLQFCLDFINQLNQLNLGPVSPALAISLQPLERLRPHWARELRSRESALPSNSFNSLPVQAESTARLAAFTPLICCRLFQDLGPPQQQYRFMRPLKSL